jgi:predicted dehydrogenase
MVAPFVPFAEPLAVQDQNFVDCITDGSRPSTDGNSGLNVLQVLECVQISMREQRPVELTAVTQAKAAIPAQRLQFRD